MKNRHLFVFAVVALSGAPAVAAADEKPPMVAKESEATSAKHSKRSTPGHESSTDHEGEPGHEGHEGKPGHEGHEGKSDQGPVDGMHDDRDGGARRPPRYRNAVGELYQDLKDGKVKKDELGAKLAQLKATRDERRKEHQEEVGKRWGATLAQAPARDELKLHARRMALLNRALVLAQSDTKPEAKKLDRISKLIDKENARHDKAMARIQPAPAAGATAGLAAAVPSSVPQTAGGRK